MHPGRPGPLADAMAIFRRQGPPALKALPDALPLLRGEIAKLVLALAERLLFLRPQLLPAVQPLAKLRLLLGTQALPALVVFADALPLLWRELLPPLPVLSNALLVLRCGRLHAARPRRLRPRAARNDGFRGETQRHRDSDQDCRRSLHGFRFSDPPTGLTGTP